MGFILTHEDANHKFYLCHRPTPHCIHHIMKFLILFDSLFYFYDFFIFLISERKPPRHWFQKQKLKNKAAGKVKHNNICVFDKKTKCFNLASRIKLRHLKITWIPISKTNPEIAFCIQKMAVSSRFIKNCLDRLNF